MKRGILGTVGSPLVQVESPPGSVIAAKVESKNPGGSAKDRPALAMVEAAERAGELQPGDRIVEPTSGNTGIGLSMVAAAKGYDITVVMPASKSPERRAIMNAYGADLELVDAAHDFVVPYGFYRAVPGWVARPFRAFDTALGRTPVGERLASVSYWDARISE